MLLFLWGICAALSGTAGLLFWRFHRDTRDRLFAMFALSFWLLAAQWVGLALVETAAETRHYFYVLRLIAFLLILAAIADKNRVKR
jgi:hypothetical protein